MRWLIDLSNVLGARPDGWWRDREGATQRLLARLEAFAATEAELTVVLDDGAPGLAGTRGRMRVVIAPRRGRDAADEEIARRVAGDPAPETLRVATSDAALARRVRAAGAEVEGAGAFRRRLEG